MDLPEQDIHDGAETVTVWSRQKLVITQRIW